MGRSGEKWRKTYCNALYNVHDEPAAPAYLSIKKSGQDGGGGGEIGFVAGSLERIARHQAPTTEVF